MPRAVGLDLGSRTLKLVELSGSAKAFKVQRVMVRDIPEGIAATPEARADLVREVMSEGRFPKDDVCASFDAGSTIFREITVPLRDDDQIEKTVRYEAENHLHGRAIEDVVVNWVRTGSTKEGTQVLIMAAPKADLRADLEVLRSAGIEPASVDLDATALFTACDACGLLTEHPDVLILEVGGRTTTLLIVQGGKLKAARSFLVGAETVTAGVQHDLSLSAGAASERALRGGASEGEDLLVTGASLAPVTTETKKSAGQLEEETVTARREDFVKKIQREVTRSIASVGAASSPDRVLLAGGGSLLPGLRASLAERLEMKVEPLTLLSRLGYRSSSPTPALEEAVSPVALGCALRLLGADPLGVELRKEEFAPSNTFEVLRTPLWVAVTLLVVILLGFFWIQKEGLEREQVRFMGDATHPNSIGGKAASIFVQVEKSYQQAVKNKGDTEATSIANEARRKLAADANYLFAVRSHLQRRYRELETDLGLSRDVPRIESALLAWVQILAAFDSIPRPELGFCRIQKLSVTQQTAVVTIELDNESNLDRLDKALTSSEYLKRRAKNPQTVVVRGNFTRDPKTLHFNGTLELPFAEESR